MITGTVGDKFRLNGVRDGLSGESQETGGNQAQQAGKNNQKQMPFCVFRNVPRKRYKKLQAGFL